MNLICAADSGKPFKRPCHSDWHYYHRSEDGMFFTQADIIALDWELKIEPREWYLWITPSGTIVQDNMSEFKAWKQIKVREVL